MKNKIYEKFLDSLDLDRFPTLKKLTSQITDKYDVTCRELDDGRKYVNDDGMQMLCFICMKIMKNLKFSLDLDNSDIKECTKSVSNISDDNLYDLYMLYVIIGDNLSMDPKPKIEKNDIISNILLTNHNIYDVQIGNDISISFWEYISHKLHKKNIIFYNDSFHKFIFPIWEPCDDIDIGHIIDMEIEALLKKLKSIEKYSKRIRQSITTGGKEYKALIFNDKSFLSIDRHISDSISKIGDATRSISSISKKINSDKKIREPLAKLSSYMFKNIKNKIKNSNVENYIAFNDCVLSCADGEIIDDRKFTKELYLFNKNPFNIKKSMLYSDDEIKMLAGEYLDIIKSSLWQKNKKHCDDIFEYFINFMASLISPKIDNGRTLMINGDGGNGKTVLEKILKKMFSDSYGLPGEFLTHKINLTSDKPSPDILKLNNKRLVYLDECEQGSIMNTAAWKFLTGGNSDLTARQLYSNDIKNINLMMKMIFANNYVPYFKEWNNAVARRLSVIKLIRTFSKDVSEISEDGTVAPADDRLDSSNDIYYGEIAQGLWPFIITRYRKLLKSKVRQIKIPNIMVRFLNELRCKQDFTFKFFFENFEEESDKKIYDRYIARVSGKNIARKNGIIKKIGYEDDDCDCDDDRKIYNDIKISSEKKLNGKGKSIHTLKYLSSLMNDARREREKDPIIKKCKIRESKEILAELYPNCVANDGDLYVGLLYNPRR